MVYWRRIRCNEQHRGATARQFAGSGMKMKATGRRTRYVLPALAVLITAPSLAQMVIQADSANLQPQILRDDVGYKSCGVRAVVVAQGERNFIDAYDFSMNIRDKLRVGLLKAGKTRVTKSQILSGKTSTDAITPAPVKFWITKESEGKAVMPQKIIPADTKGYILEGADLVQTMEVIMATINGERMQFAVRYKNEPLDVVVSFAATMPDHEKKPLMACFNGIIERMTADPASKEAP
jgi:hypothetical protein